MLTTAQIKEWAATCGNSFYLLDLDTALANYQELLSAGRAIYPAFGIAYSVKTNYTPALCKALVQAGALLEVVSEMEYHLALQAGCKAENIVVNGPAHAPEFIEQILGDGAIINFDSWYQIDVLETFAKQNPSRLMRFGIRVMLNLEPRITSRFGFPEEKELLHELAARFRKIKNAQLVSLHCHFCEGARHETSYRQRAQQMLELRESYFQDFPVSVFNLGGGFYSKMPADLQAQFSEKIPEAAVYADALCQPFAERFAAGAQPTLLIEPGNIIVADAMEFYCPVLDIKQSRNRTVAILDGSIFDIKPTRNKKNLPLTIINQTATQTQVNHCDLTGFTCLEDDVLYNNYKGPLAAGDYAVFGNTGAYTNVMRPPFIRPAAAIVAKQGDALFMVKKPGNLSSVLHDYS